MRGLCGRAGRRACGPGGFAAATLVLFASGCGLITGVGDLQEVPAEAASVEGGSGDTGVEGSRDGGDGGLAESGRGDSPAPLDAARDGAADVVSPPLEGGTVDSAAEACVGSPSDPHNCGSCGFDCMGGGCNGGVCGPVPVLLASGVYGAHCLALTADAIYFTSEDQNSVYVIPKIGALQGNATTVASAQPGAYGIALDSVNVYWTTAGTSANGNLDGTVATCPLAGTYPCSPTVLAMGQTFPRAPMTVDSANVYWETFSTTSNGAVFSMPKTGSTPVILANVLSGLQGIAVDSSYVYFSDLQTIYGVPLGGSAGPPTVLVPSASGVQFISLENAWLYWPQTSDGDVHRATNTGGSVTLLGTSGISAYDAVSDASNVYWTDTGGGMQTDGTVWEVAIAGGTPYMLASEQSGVRNIAVDASYVYFTTDSSGLVQKVPIH